MTSKKIIFEEDSENQKDIFCNSSIKCKFRVAFEIIAESSSAVG